MDLEEYVEDLPVSKKRMQSGTSRGMVCLAVSRLPPNRQRPDLYSSKARIRPVRENSESPHAPQLCHLLCLSADTMSCIQRTFKSS